MNLLPLDATECRVVLFFLDMPAPLVALAWALLQAQTALVHDVDAELRACFKFAKSGSATRLPATAWVAYYNRHKNADEAGVALPVLTGGVLIDGSEPSGQASRVLAHATYKALFGDHAFQVHKVGASDAYQTLHRFGGCLFDLRFVGKELLVQERYRGDPTSGSEDTLDVVLELCPPQ